MSSRLDITSNLDDHSVVGGYAWRWQWTYWSSAGASRTW
jgi:hypothetical protein